MLYISNLNLYKNLKFNNILLMSEPFRYGVGFLPPKFE